ncbi:hypothetical protein L484_008601 [Morus notabilis]|uniref:Uncharacterized protein n=1 Tax=Morus notabilis TaxID=981085 RepID=W9QJD5_9ROSA|nr:uncharacterized protein LOC21391962 [Morus notabilis]EXB38573.1 hypothetical protein L484_008601 [Morus notabilis]
MASRTLFLQVLVIVLCFSHLIFSNAVPVTRIRGLMHGNQAHDLPQGTIHKQVTTEKILEEKTVAERMDVELHDYPGSGANNRHTPKPQFGRCADC